MGEKEEYEYGQPIPSKYRNGLLYWEGGGKMSKVANAKRKAAKAARRRSWK